MKRLIFAVSGILFFFSASQVFAQSGTFSAGLLTSWQKFQESNFTNELSNPMGVGIAANFRVHEKVGFQFIGIRAHSSMNGTSGTETDIHLKTAVLFYPVTMGVLQPYISGGYSYLAVTQRPENQESVNNKNMYVTYGLGTDITLFSQLLLNWEFRTYNDGLGFVGYMSNVGLRIKL